MFAPLIAFLIAAAFVPGMAGAATSPRWAVAAISLWFLEWWCLPFVVLAFFWLEIDQTIHWAIVCAALCWGLKTDQLRSVTIAFGIGVVVSSFVAVFQLLGWDGIPQVVVPGGLFLNKNVMGEAACLVFILAWQQRLFWIALGVAPALILSTSRGVALATLAGLFVLLSSWQRWLLVSICLAGALIWLVNGKGVGSIDSVFQRFSLWQHALQELHWLGNGSYDFSTGINREPNLHNDWLQLIYEFGIIGILPCAVVFFAAGAGPSAPIIAFIVLASFSFPLHSPATAWLFAFVVGDQLRRYAVGCRVILRPRLVTEIYR